MNAQDVINAITDQRNAALNELALTKAQLAAANRKIEELTPPVELSDVQSAE